MAEKLVLITKPLVAPAPPDEDGFLELNPPTHDPVLPYNIQGGKDAAGVPSTYEDLFGYRPQLQAIQDSVVNNTFGGSSVSITSSMNDILCGQVFGG